MRIEIVDVSSPVSVKKYFTIEVSFKEDGKIKGKKLMSFVHPQVFKDVQNFVKGDFVEVETVKEGDYWQWVSVRKVSASDAAPSETSSSSGGSAGKQSYTPATKSTYETPEERAVRQRLIVRQSSLAQAVTVLNVGAKAPVDKDTVFGLAEAFTDFVFEQKPADLSKDYFADFEDDVPL